MALAGPARRPRRRRSDALLVAAALTALSFLVCWLHARALTGEDARAEGAAVVKRFGLTDLALFNEARYTRHPSQADLFAPFQDHPGALEHFPSGSLVAPPALE